MKRLNLKLMGILTLSILLALGLLQIDAIGNLHPVLRSIAASIQWMVGWILGPDSSDAQRIIVIGKQGEFLDANRAQSRPSLPFKPALPRNHTGMGMDKSGTSMMEFLKRDFGYSPQDTTNESADSQTHQFLQELAAHEDPVTNLFPENEVEYDDYDLENILTDDNGENNTDAALNAEVVAPLLDEIRTDLEEKLELDSLDEVMQEE